MATPGVEMTRDDRFYAFIVARTSRSRAHIRRICVHKRWLRASAVALVVMAAALLYGFYGLTEQSRERGGRHIAEVGRGGWYLGAAGTTDAAWSGWSGASPR